MRNFLVSSVLSLFVFVNVQSQKSGVAQYRVIPKDVNAILDQNDGEANAIIKQILNASKDFDFVLYFDAKESLYYREEQLSTGNSTALSQKLAKALTDKGVHYQNKEQDVSIRTFFGLGKEYRIQDNLFLEFTITKERKKIREFECIKAILNCFDCGGKPIVVWFAPNVPIPFGPEGYGGLPGLIVEVEKKMFSLQLSSLEFKTLPKNKIKTPNKGEVITKEAYRKLSKRMRKNSGF
ncbi:GLPGLI family protein [Dokdonia sp.]|uniref:GLPGLI family protein n=1 Tax=Dokdonia sp. TaxID=2024995 RepID=UPI0032646F6E